MKEIIDKISSYNLFNYLFPGIVFVILISQFTSYDLYQENNLFGVFLYYFIGLVISRFGSLIIEPILQKSSFVKFAKYSDYIHASDKDKKVELFSEINNMYRTLISLLILTLLAKLYEIIAIYFKFSQVLSNVLLIITLLIIFIFSYRKQTKYVVKRVDSRNKNKSV